MTKVRVGGEAVARTGGGSSVTQKGTLRPQGTYAGYFDPSIGLPTVGTGQNGAILKGDWWEATGNGTIVGLSPFTEFQQGDTISARVNNADSSSDFIGNKATGGTTSNLYTVLDIFTTPISITGTTAITKVYSYLITANTIEENDILSFRITASKVSVGSDLADIRVYFNIDDSLSGATQIARLQTNIASVTYFKLSRELIVTSVNNQFILSSTSLSFPNDVTNNAGSSFPISQLNIDFTQPQYFIVALSLVNSTDTITLRSSILEKLRA